MEIPISEGSESTGHAASTVAKVWRSGLGSLLLILLWVSGIAVGMRALLAHEAGAGRPADAPVTWPANVSIPRDGKHATLVMLAHPKCPCTRASIGELAVAMAKLGGLATAHVLFTMPEGVREGWERTDQWSSAARIPGVTVHADPGGRQSSLFGARTSGQVLLYASDGRRLFSGGITPGRGHMGDNVGLDRILSLVRVGAADRVESSVFGCALFEEQP